MKSAKKYSTTGRLKVLFLPAWYPHRNDPMWGLFVERHAKAVSGFADVAVAYLVADNALRGLAMNTELTAEQGLTVCRVYYSSQMPRLSVLSLPVKALRMARAWCTALRTLRREVGKPQIAHVHVLTRAALPALWLRFFHGIPYVITEHWSRYLPETDGFKGILRRCFTRFAVRRAGAVTTVTHNLASAMQSHGLKNKWYIVVPNCVDTNVFKLLTKTEDGIHHWVHISVFDDKSKNISGMLRAVATLAEHRSDFILHMIGDGVDFEAMKKLAGDLNLNDRVIFEGLMVGAGLAEMLAKAEMLLLFSNYENIPVVINEAMVCGVTVIATSVGGIPEYVSPSTGILVEARDEPALVQAMLGFLEGRYLFDAETMSRDAHERFSYDAVGKAFMSIYHEVLNR